MSPLGVMSGASRSEKASSVEGLLGGVGGVALGLESMVCGLTLFSGGAGSYYGRGTILRRWQKGGNLALVTDPNPRHVEDVIYSA